MTDKQIRAVIKRTEPRLNGNAIERMLCDFEMRPICKRGPAPNTPADVAAAVRKEVQDADTEAKKHPIPGMKWDGVTMLNEAADEMAFEARVS